MAENEAAALCQQPLGLDYHPDQPLVTHATTQIGRVQVLYAFVQAEAAAVAVKPKALVAPDYLEAQICSVESHY